MSSKLHIRKTMKRFGHIILLIVFAVSTALAQPGDNERFEKIRAIKVSYITDKIHLTSEQAARFWPVYNRYDDELRNERRRIRQQIMKEKNLTEDDARKYIHDNLAYQEKKVELKKKYKDELLKIITPQQLAELYQAEQGFKQILLHQLGDKR